MDQRSFQNLLRRTVALPVVLLGCLAVLLVSEILLLYNSLRWVDHSEHIIANARQVGRSIVEADTGLRGYYLTGDALFLNSYTDAKAHLPEQLDELARLSADNPSQQERMRKIRDLNSQWMQWADQEVAIKGGRATAPELLTGQNLLNKLRDQQRSFVNAESALLMHRSQLAKRLNVVVVGSAVGLSLLIALLLLTLTRRELMALSSSYERHLEAETEQRRQVNESREWFQSTLNSLGEAVITTDQAGRITYLNPVAQRLTGWDYTEANGRSFPEVVRLADERTRVEAEDPIQMVIQQRSLVAFSDGLLLTSRQGVAYPLELTGAPILDRLGKVLGISIVFRDLTQRRQTEQTLRTSERLTMAGRMSATIAHEIRNPLDTVSNLLYLLQREKPTSAQSHFLNMASDEVARIAQITSQLLTFHRESRSPIMVSMSEVLESVLAVFAPQIRQNRIEVTKCFGTDKRICGFPGELRQVFSNLVGNAIEVLPRGGRLMLHTRDSSLSYDHATWGVRVTVLDTGSGIPAHIRKNLFEPFYTTKGEKGTGLGLWISRGIVEKHEGSIHFSSSTTEGSSWTAFSVFLPYQQRRGLLDPKAEPPTT